MGIRVDEHQNDQKNKNTICKQHIRINPSQEFGYSEVEVIDSEGNEKNKEIASNLKKSPILNTQHDSKSKYEIKPLIIRAYPKLTRILKESKVSRTEQIHRITYGFN